MEASSEAGQSISTEDQTVAETPEFIPVFTKLSDIYTDLDGSLKDVHEGRYLNTTKRFEQLYEQKPEFFIRSPARVTIVGEQISSSGFKDFQVPIDQDVVIAYSKHTKPEIWINNIDMALFPEEILDTDPSQKMREEDTWINHFLAGYKAIMRSTTVEEEISRGFEPVGMKIFIDSLIPFECGLSSGKSFIMCVALLTMHANGLINKIDNQEYVKCINQGLQFIGREHDKIDISYLASKKDDDLDLENSDQIDQINTGNTLKGYSFVISNSLTPSSKFMGLYTRHKKRVVELRIATILLAMEFDKNYDISNAAACQYTSLAQLQKANNWSFEEMLSFIESKLKRGGYSKPELEEALNSSNVVIDLNDVEHIYEVWQNNFKFSINETATHVITEAQRVQKFCKNPTPIELGECMDASQESLKSNFDCSSKELDELISLCKENDALGSKLTGNGWGGCSISLVEDSHLKEFIDSVYTYYSKERAPGEQLWITDDIDRYIFSSKSSAGPCVLDPQYCLWF
ncbi:unnamed protein product [Moneuplotes crassus]|uniref:Galactokinase n=1 Tax=Euplotes crassus TaxID=5936 RepID=A0AAD1XD47_EUPCR|nr:unnamed protein product [Moneuplotes crassus]